MALPKTLVRAKLPKGTWQERIFSNTLPGAPLHSILACVFDVEPSYPARYFGKANVTSDGFLLADFQGTDGQRHGGAFVGSFDGLKRNVIGIADHVGLKGDDRTAFFKTVEGWIATDYSGKAKIAA